MATTTRTSQVPAFAGFAVLGLVVLAASWFVRVQSIEGCDPTSTHDFLVHAVGVKTLLAAVPVALSTGAAAVMPSRRTAWLFFLCAAVSVVWIHLTITAFLPDGLSADCSDGVLPAGPLRWLPGAQMESWGD